MAKLLGKDTINGYAPAEVMYAAADNMFVNEQLAPVIKERLEKDIKDDHLRHLLVANDVAVKILPGNKGAKISIKDRKISSEEAMVKLEKINIALKDAGYVQ